MKKYLFKAAVVLGMGILLSVAVGHRSRAAAQSNKNEALSEEAQPEEVSPLEDLMREHGLLRRVMLIYEHETNCREPGPPCSFEAVLRSVGIIHDFIEGYHEKLEEDYIFPIFEKAGMLAGLTRTLREQHQAGRRLTLAIIQFSKEGRPGTEENLLALSDQLRSFIKMYRPHAAREDTVLFPALRRLVSGKDYERLGDKFESIEHELFGENGFEGKTAEVADLEKKLGIYELSKFTPAKL